MVGRGDNLTSSFTWVQDTAIAHPGYANKITIDQFKNSIHDDGVERLVGGGDQFAQFILYSSEKINTSLVPLAHPLFAYKSNFGSNLNMKGENPARVHVFLIGEGKFSGNTHAIRKQLYWF